MKKILKTGLWIIISILIVAFIIHFLFYGNRRYIFPVEIGKIEVNYDVHQGIFTSINWSPASALNLLDQIEQEKSYVNVEELEQLRAKLEDIDRGYIIVSRGRPLRYIIHYDGWTLLGENSLEEYGSQGRYGEDSGNVIYFYRVRQEIGWPYDGEI